MKHIIVFTFFSFLLSSCTKNDSAETGIPAEIVTGKISSINSYSAIGGGSVTNDGGSAVTSKGICFSSTVTVPNLNDSLIFAGPGAGDFTCTLTGLLNNTKYFVRAFAINKGGTTYGSREIFITAFALGQNYQGGIIYYIDNSHQHGYIAAPSDQDSAAVWGCAGVQIPGADLLSVGAGRQNTNDIVSGCTTAGIAAALCKSLSLNGYNDWFLPSHDELKPLYGQRVAVGGFTGNFYWSSTENNSGNAYRANFTDGTMGNAAKGAKMSVRAIRAF